MNIVIPICDYFLDDQQHTDLMTQGDIYELRDRDIIPPVKKTYWYHSSVNILEPFTEDTLQQLSKKQQYPVSRFSCHMLTRYKQYTIRQNNRTQILIGESDLYTISEITKHIQDNIEHIKTIFGDTVEIQFENIPYTCDPYDTVYSPNFITHCLTVGDAGFLFDIPHGRISAYNRGIPFDEYLKKLPLHRCDYIHISRYRIQEGYAYDVHERLSNNDFIFLQQLLRNPLFSSVNAVAIEYYDDYLNYIAMLQHLRRIL